MPDTITDAVVVPTTTADTTTTTATVDSTTATPVATTADTTTTTATVDSTTATPVATTADTTTTTATVDSTTATPVATTADTTTTTAVATTADSTTATADSTATPTTDSTAEIIPLVLEERLIARYLLNQAIQKDGNYLHIAVLFGPRYGVGRTVFCWAKLDTLTPQSFAEYFNVPYNQSEGDYIHIDKITDTSIITGVPIAETIKVIQIPTITNTQNSAST